MPLACVHHTTYKNLQALKLQYPTSEGYCIHEPIVFQFQKPENGSEPYILVSIQDERCVVAANPPSRIVSSVTELKIQALLY